MNDRLRIMSISSIGSWLTNQFLQRLDIHKIKPVCLIMDRITIGSRQIKIDPDFNKDGTGHTKDSVFLFQKTNQFQNRGHFNQNFNAGNPNRSRNNDRVCFNCRQPNHFSRDCPNRPNNNKPKFKPNSEDVNVDLRIYVCYLSTREFVVSPLQSR